MLVANYQLFKTGLDPAYTNVYDGYTTETQYYNFLNTFPVKTPVVDILPEGNNRSIKSKDGNMFLVINMSYDDIMFYGYNYVMLDYVKIYDEFESPRRYYFITNVESLNDEYTPTSTRNPSCRLTLKYDAWANNYVENIRNDTHMQKVARLTQNHYLPGAGETPQVIVKNDVPNMEPTSRNLNYDNIVGEGLLCLGMQLAYEKCSIKNGDIEVKDSVMPSQRNAPVIYVPVKWYTKDAGTTGTITLIDSSGDIRTVIGSNGIFTLQDYVNHVAVLDAWLTFYGCNVSEIPDSEGRYQLINSYIVNVDLYTTGEETPLSFTAIAATNYTYTKVIDCRNYLQFPSTTDYSKQGYAELSQFSEELNIYPFKSKALKVGNDFLNMSINNVQTQSITITRNNSTTAYIVWNRFTNNNARTALNNKDFQVGKYVDSLELYYMKNSNIAQVNEARAWTKIGFATAKSAIGAGLLSATGGTVGYGSLTSGFENLAGGILDIHTIDAIARDANNALDSYDMPPNIGSDSYYFDGVFECDTSIENETSKMSYFYETHFNGSYVSGYATINNTERKFFDYIRTEGCSLPNIPVLTHRIEIENASNRGIRKFHINYTYKPPLISLDAEYCNSSE